MLIANPAFEVSFVSTGISRAAGGFPDLGSKMVMWILAAPIWAAVANTFLLEMKRAAYLKREAIMLRFSMA